MAFQTFNLRSQQRPDRKNGPLLLKRKSAITTAIRLRFPGVGIFRLEIRRLSSAGLAFTECDALLVAIGGQQAKPVKDSAKWFRGFQRLISKFLNRVNKKNRGGGS